MQASIQPQHSSMRSIQRYARLAGALYVIVALLAGFIHFYVPGQLLVPGDATTTAQNIQASEGMFRVSMASELVVGLIEVVLSLLLYRLLRPVSHTLSLVAAASRLVMTTIHGLNVLNSVVVLILLSGAGYLTVFAPEQLHALVRLFLDASSYGYTIGIVFFALHTGLLGYLIFQSGYFPKFLGVLLVVASAGYFVDSFAYMLIANHQTGAVYFAMPIAMAEIAFPLWLLIKGVNAERWQHRTRVNLEREQATQESYRPRPTATIAAPLAAVAPVGAP